MSHYETLGVEPGASLQDIKRAFRAKSMAAHPDREGGSHEAMAAVNQAYAVLSDPERRQRYDANGEDKAQPSIEDQARSVLAQIFTQALEGGRNIVTFSRETLGQVQAAAKNQLSQHLAQVAALQSRRDKVCTFDGEVNMVHAIIDGKLVQLNAAARQVEKHIEVLAAAEQQLGAYASTEYEPGHLGIYAGTTTSAIGGWR